MTRKIKVFQTALYARLSVEDSGKQDNEVIQNQIRVMKEFVRNNSSITIFGIYVDNGWTGTDFKRPEFHKMMKAVEQKKIDCIIVKDLSRFGRNYIEAGMYLEKVLPLLGVRFIAITDGLDTLTADFSSELYFPLKNIVNDMYAKDISKKVSSSLYIKAERGECGGGVAPYGYKKNGTKLEIDMETAHIVRRIFFMRADGKSYHAIARQLNEEGVLSPSAYRYQKGIVKNERYKNVLWKRHVLTSLLENRVYVGELIRGKTKKALYQGIVLKNVSRDQQKVFPNAHSAIIDKTLFDKVQTISEKRRNKHIRSLGKYNYLGKEEDLFGFRVVCGDCGYVLGMHRNVVRETAVYYTYICPNFVENRNLVCISKNIKKKDLEEAGLEILKLYLELFLYKANQMLKKDNHKFKLQIQKKNMKLGKVEVFAENLYIEYKEGFLTEYEYFLLKEKHQKELACTKAEIVALTKQNTTYKQQLPDLLKLTKELAECFFYKITVYEGNRFEIIFSFHDY